MEFNRITLAVGLLVVMVVGFIYVWKPDLSPTALVSGNFSSYNPFIGQVSTTMETLFKNNPQAVIEQGGRIGLLLPGGNSVQFSKDGKLTEQDVVIILNATNTKITTYNTFPDFKQNEFTFVPADQLINENPYVRAQYPDGLFLMPVNVD